MNDLELYFQFRCEKGFQARHLPEDDTYRSRLTYEVGVITSMGFCGYFLIVSDFIRWAISQNILVGPGRGSAAGSLVSYVLFITHVDPVKYKLYFERFLSPSRISMPDIDVDFDELQRDEVIHYLSYKFGEKNVARIGTFGKMKARAAIRSIARTLDYPYETGDKLANLILPPIAGRTQNLQTCYEQVEELRNYRRGQETPESIILSWAERFEDRLQNAGMHASGVVISQTPVYETIPLFSSKDNQPTTQWEMNSVEKVGLVKFDLLGLRALTTISRCCALIEKTNGIKIDILNIPVDDEGVYAQLRTGDTTGIFQFEGSSGITDLVSKVKPSNLEDLSTITALYRPGPLSCGMSEQFIKARNSDTPVEFIVPELREILGRTSGVLVYQEQIMEVCKQLAGYTLDEADSIRKAIGKKLLDKMELHRNKFKNGIVAHGYTETQAIELFQQIEGFASYSFNYAHSLAYSLISYQMAYLKCHYPSEFMCACLESDSDEADKLVRYISYCRDAGIGILPPDVNLSQADFSLEWSDQKKAYEIRFGLGAIKNLGPTPVMQIIEERRRGGLFLDLIQFAARVDLSIINRKKLESLVLAGAFESLGVDRSSLLLTIDDVMEYKEATKRYLSKLATWEGKEQKRLAREAEIQGGSKKKPFKRLDHPVVPLSPAIRKSDPISKLDQLSCEHELLGFYVSGHPLDHVSNLSESCLSILEVSQQDNKAVCMVAAIPVVIKEVTTRKKQRMAQVSIEDKSGMMPVVIFPKTFEQVHSLLQVGSPLLWKISIDKSSDEETEVVRGRVMGVTQLQTREERVKPRRLQITSQLAQASQLLTKLKRDEKYNPVSFTLVLDGELGAQVSLSWIAPANYEALKQEFSSESVYPNHKPDCPS